MRNGRHSNDRRSRHGGGGGGGGRGRNHRGGRNNNRRRHQQRNPRMAAEGGNKRERIAIESGYLVLIDQFMLANPEFVTRLQDVVDQDPDQKDGIVKEFGGVVIELEPGTYRIDRDPFQYQIIVHPEDEAVKEAKEITEQASEQRGDVFVDTRCLAMIDRELLDDTGLLEKYQELWFGGQDKACRDLLRDNGGAVRYGFQRYGDELQVFSVPGKDIICLMPNPATMPAMAAQPEAEVAAAAE